MLADAEDAMGPEDAQVVAEARREKNENKGKPKKKGKKRKGFANDEFEHNEFCEVCKQG